MRDRESRRGFLKRIDEGVRIQAIVSMAEKSYRERRMAHFDPASRKMRA